jgi:hypothetical protein
MHYLLRPAFFIETAGLGFARWLGEGKAGIIQRKNFAISPAFLAAGALGFVREIILEGAQQKRPEPPAFRFRATCCVVFEEVEKKSLGQILGVGLGKTAAMEIGKKRLPIVAAEFFESVATLRDGFSGGPDAAPSRRGKECGIDPWLRGSRHRAMCSAEHAKRRGHRLVAVRKRNSALPSPSFNHEGSRKAILR